MPKLAEQALNRLIWTAALRSGRFEQTKERLGSLEDGMCCLGVGCHVLGIPFDPSDSFPPEEFCKKVGLGYVEFAEINGEYDGGSLVNLNDVEEKTFPEISLIIENTPSLWEGSDFQEGRLAEHEAEQAAWDTTCSFESKKTPLCGYVAPCEDNL